MKTLSRLILAAATLLGVVSCRIEPPLRLPAQEVLVDLPVVLTDLDIVWDIDADLSTNWYYGWDNVDQELFGDLTYPEPTNFEVRRYFLGPEMNVPHSDVDAFTVYDKTFRRKYEFGYYDLLIWSNIDSEDGTQVVTINESDLDNVMASTTVTKGMTGLSKGPNPTAVTGIFNQPEIFYSTYARNIHISHEYDDYDYYNEEEGVYVKVINTNLSPLVYIYLVQVLIQNNEDGRVKTASGNAALSAMANSTNVNNGHTAYDPCTVYFSTRMKQDVIVDGKITDIIGGKLTTYGLCDMEPYTRAGAKYEGSLSNLPNYLYIDVTYSNDTEETLRFDVTKQCQEQAHGGIITITIDAHDLKVPDSGDVSAGSLFVPTVEDYDEIIYDIPM